MIELFDIAEMEGIEIFDIILPYGLKGIYYDRTIALNISIETAIERRCVLAEELGHHFTTVGNILDMKIESNRKQEQRARAWAFNTLAPFDKIIEAYEKGYVSTYEMAEYLNVTEDFLKEAILYYQNKK